VEPAAGKLQGRTKEFFEGGVLGFFSRKTLEN